VAKPTLDAEKAKQDSATIESFKIAKAGLAKAPETAIGATAALVKTAFEFSTKKAEARSVAR